MSLRIGLAQSGYPSEGTVVSMVESFAAAARQQGVQLLAFPESLMCPRKLTADELRDISEPLDGPFATALRNLAQTYGLWIVFTMSETNPAGGPPYNTAVVVDDTGTVRGTYRKCHLYDAHHVRESDRMSAGDALFTPVVTPFCTLGLGICYDLRFPEAARTAALAGCDLILYPAAWYDGPHKADHWETLLRARAIENECFVAGICHADRSFVGRSLVADPLGRVLAKGSPASSEKEAEALVVADLNMEAVTSARDAMPVFEHRRPALYER